MRNCIHKRTSDFSVNAGVCIEARESAGLGIL